MKIVDAVWEKRSLDVECKDCVVSHEDALDDIEQSIIQVENTQYLVAKIPSNRIDVLMLFEKHGYGFIEAAIKLDLDMRKIIVPKRLEVMKSKLRWEIMQQEDLEILYKEIDNNIFKTDRIILDPYFTPKQAADRYKYWTMDLVKAGNVPYKVYYDDEVIGFFLNKEVSPGVYDGILAGVYGAYEGTGMGVCIQYAGILFAQEMSAKKYIGHVSANNPAVLKSLEMIGFKVKLIEYVLIKHN